MKLQTARSAVLLMVAALGWTSVGELRAQTTGATFGQVIRLSGTPSDIVLDESRGRLYLVNANAGRVDIWDYNLNSLLTSVKVGTTPYAAAISMDNAYLYVTNNASSTLSVIDLGLGGVVATVTLPAKPEGVEVGNDGRVLISTQGSGANNALNTLLIYDASQTSQQQVTAVAFPPPPVTPAVLPPVGSRPVSVFRGKLKRTPDGQYILGVSVVNNNASTISFVYEVASGTVLRSRTVVGQSTVVSMSPDGGSFMAGFTLYDTRTLATMAQMSTSNSPFPILQSTGAAAQLNLLQNQGGSAFSPDGGTIYATFNVAPFAQPAVRPQASTLFVADARNLSLKLGIKLRESIIAKMVMTSDGAKAWGLSESGMLYLPLGELYDYPLLMPETNQVFLAQDDCNRGIATGRLRINNLGAGKLTFAVPSTGNSLQASVASGLAPSTITFSMDPGRNGTTRLAGTNLSSTAGLNGAPFSVNLASPNAINIPNTIRVYMNYRTTDMRGQIFPVPTSIDNNAGLTDIYLDEPRGLVYITNTGFNRIEIFDTKKQRFLAPIGVCQLPRQMAVTPDGLSMYVACLGSETIAVVDLEQQAVTGQVDFPPVPRAGNAAVVAPRTLAWGLSGLQFVTTAGTVWRVVGNQALPRDPTAVIGILGNGAQRPIGQATMLATPDAARIVLLDATGNAFLYDAMADAFTAGASLIPTPLTSYYGLLGAATDNSFLLVDGMILNDGLGVIGGSANPSAGGNALGGSSRHIASVAGADTSSFLRLTVPVRANITSAVTGDARTLLERVDVRTGAQTLVGVVPENPFPMLFGTALSRLGPRLMVVDAQATTAYMITLSGLSVVPLAPASTANKPVIAGGVRGIVNASDGAGDLYPGAFVTINGSALAATAAADQTPLPTVLGGSCVVINDVPLPLIQTGPGQIAAQIPDTLRPGTYILNVRSLALAQSSDPVIITIEAVK